jgi:hypothetical protein
LPTCYLTATNGPLATPANNVTLEDMTLIFDIALGLLLFKILKVCLKGALLWVACTYPSLFGG